jgi:hypothetical protein
VNKSTGPSAKAGGLEHFRRLKRHEIVSPGDFVADQQNGFEPWNGPGGFRADAFLKPIYRRETNLPPGAGSPGQDSEVEPE